MKSKILSFIPLLSFMVIVFLFSNAPADNSEKTSMGVTKTIINIISNNNSNNIDERVELLDPIIRKIAHFSLYIVGGLCIMLHLNTYKLNEKQLFIYSMYFIIIYAFSDEIHQYFVPGRGMLLTDVLIDSLGGTVGISFFMCVEKIIKRSNKLEIHKEV